LQGERPRHGREANEWKEVVSQEGLEGVRNLFVVIAHGMEKPERYRRGHFSGF